MATCDSNSGKRIADGSRSAGDEAAAGKLDVFVSYANENKDVADALVHVLERNGLRCWIAPRDIVPGSNWSASIIKGIQRCKSLVLVFSAQSNASQQVLHEVERAVHRGLPILPFRIEEAPIEPALDLFIASRHWLDAFSGSMEAHLEALATALRQLLATLPSARPSRPPPPPAVRTASKWTPKAIGVAVGVALALALLAALIAQSLTGFDQDRFPQYASRFSSERDTGWPEARASIDAALKWLEAHQDNDGKWDCDGFMKHDNPGSAVCNGEGNATNDVGVTGLALLAFLGDGNTMRSGRFRESVMKGTAWLKNNQQDNGIFGTNNAWGFIYGHAIATYAMCEAFGLSDDPLLKTVAQKGIDHLESHRNPYSVWRYQPRDNDNDTSVTGWCITACVAGNHFGLDVNNETLALGSMWLDQVSDPTGLHGYSKQGEPSSRKPGDHQTRFPERKGHAMTAVGLFCRFFMGQNPMEEPVMKAAADLLLTRPPKWDPRDGSIDHYYWYYATHALFQMGGPHWTDWRDKIEIAVVRNQHRDKGKPNQYGSWDPIDVWGEDGGRVYSTAMLTLTLQANYRYTKLAK
jgi:hypothetical protein